MKRASLSLCIILCILTYAFSALQKAPASPDERQIFIVLLKEPSVSAKLLQAIPNPRADLRRGLLRSERAMEYRKVLRQKQVELVSRPDRPALLAAEGPLEPVEVLDAQTDLLNALVIRASPKQAADWAARTEVEGVYPNLERRLLTDALPAFLGATAYWNSFGGAGQAGAGVRIGIIDSGININHPMFRDLSLTPPAGFPPSSSAPGYTNSKVIVARSYVDTRYGLENQADKTPRDERGHGSNVAAIAAGAIAESPVGKVQGIAPKAFLGNYKVFGQPGLNDITTSSAIIAALNDALTDGMDVINLSLGGDPRNPENDPEQKAIAQLAALGVVVAAAAGNSGPKAGTIASPGTSPEVITVGATSHTRVFLSSLNVTSSSPVPADLRVIEFVPGTGAPINSPSGPWALISISALDGTELACNPLPSGSLAGKVALLKRGECLFSVKAAHVLDGAGATGMVVYNNVEDPPVIMDFGDDPPSKPAVMIRLADGESLRDFILSHASEVVFRPEEAFPAPADMLASFSARGPSITQEIKPDLSAPGQDIYTASNDNGNYRRGANGTSFSTPAVAGAAALIRQQHPDWPSRYIKSVLVNTASRTVTENGAPARVNEGGNGRLNLARVLNARGVVWPVSVSYGVISDGAVRQLDRTVDVTNTDSLPRTFSFSTVAAEAPQGVDVRAVPSSLQLGPGQSRTLQLRLLLPSGAKSGTFEGYLRIRDDAGGTDLTVSYWGALAVEGSSRILQVSGQPGTGQYGTIGAALAEALPGDVIEIADSETYPSGVSIDTNNEGLPLHGLTLRAAAGQTPVILATDEEVGVGVFSLQNVTLRGLTIQGGDTGILYLDSSGVIQGNRIESTQERAASRISLQSSRAHILDNTISTFLGSGLTLFDSPALVQYNTLGEEIGLGVHGIFAGPTASSSFQPVIHRAVSIFDNTIRGAGSVSIGQGVRISASPALLKGNTISNSPGRTSDGILATGQETTVSIVDNLIRNHDRIGVWINGGAAAQLSGNTIRTNGMAGLQMENARVSVRSSRVLENVTGVSAVFSELSLQDTLVAVSGFSSTGGGDGVSATQSQVSIVNSTLAANRLTGARLSGGAGTIANSIFALNGENDLTGHQGHTVTTNLFDSHPLAGIAGNIAGDPRFSDPGAMDFSLSPGSPAIDQGSMAFTDSASDLLFHKRVVDGNQDSVPAPDLGAIEFASGHSPSLVLPVLSNKPGEFVGLALANLLSLPEDAEVSTRQATSTEVTLRLFDRGGRVIDEHRESILGGTQISVLLDEIFPSLPEGWVEILPTNRQIMSFTLLGTGSLSFLDGAQLSDSPASKLLFPELRNDGTDSTTLYLVNPANQAAQLTIEWIDESGSLRFSSQQSLSPRSMLSGSLDEIFDLTSCSGQSCESGHLVVSASHPIFGMEIFGNENHRGGLLALDYDAGAADVFAAQLASTSDLETILNVINTGPATTLTVTARDDEGIVIGMPVTTQIPAGGQWRFPAAEAFQFSGPVVGWVEVHSLSGPVQGNIVFGDPDGKFLSALPLQGRGAREFVLSHVAQTAQIFTGVTLLNPGPGTALFSVEVFDRTGIRTGLALSELETGQKRARLLPEIVPGLTEQAEGFIRVRSNLPLLGFEIFGGTSLEFFSAVPQQVLTY